MWRRPQRERLNSIIDNVRNALLDANIGYTGLAVKDDAIVFTVRDPARIDAARQALTKIDPDLTVAIMPNGAGTVGFSAAATEQKRIQAVDQSIEIIRRRIDETGIKEPTIEREGATASSCNCPASPIPSTSRHCSGGPPS